ncbi:hypothetical protein ACFVW8_31795 [Streptomyces sp. NPDC058221]|uniref:hypothetical protein n=1 Tax=Streptomyces sp. NPDC058221 TaxID=3346388 RepID=UPI0036EEF435
MQARVAVLCQELSRWPTIRERIEAVGGVAKLDELLVAVTAARPSEDSLIRELLDEVARIGDTIGLPSLTTELRGPVPRVPGARTPRVQVAWVCPAARCGRVELVEDTRAVPTCVIAGGARLAPYPPMSTSP